MTNPDQTPSQEPASNTEGTLKLPQNQEPPKEVVQQPPAPANNLAFDVGQMTQDEKDQKGREWGYKPTDSFQGDKSKHMDVDTYLRVSQQKLPAVLNQNRKQDSIIKTQQMMIDNMQKDIDSKQAALDSQKLEASEDNDLYKFDKLQKEERALEKRQEDLQTHKEQLNEPSLDNYQDNNQAAAEEEEEATQFEVRQWSQDKPFILNPQTKEDFANKAFVDSKWNQYKRSLPNAPTAVILEQVSRDLAAFNQANNSSNYSPAGTGGTPPVSNERSEANLTADAQRRLNSILSRAANDTQKAMYKDQFINHGTNDESFKWYKK